MTALSDVERTLARRVSHRAELKLVVITFDEVRKMPPGRFTAMGTSGLLPVEMRAVLHAIHQANPPGASAMQFGAMLGVRVAQLADFEPERTPETAPVPTPEPQAKALDAPGTAPPVPAPPPRPPPCPPPRPPPMPPPRASPPQAAVAIGGGLRRSPCRSDEGGNHSSSGGWRQSLRSAQRDQGRCGRSQRDQGRCWKSQEGTGPYRTARAAAARAAAGGRAQCSVHWHAILISRRSAVSGAIITEWGQFVRPILISRRSAVSGAVITEWGQFVRRADGYARGADAQGERARGGGGAEYPRGGGGGGGGGGDGGGGGGDDGGGGGGGSYNRRGTHCRGGGGSSSGTGLIQPQT